MLKNFRFPLLFAMMTFIVASPTVAVFAEETDASNSASMTTTNENKVKINSIKKERKAELNFEDELVEGSTQKPELFYLFQKKNFNYKRLVKLRENFLPEMRKSTEDVQRVRGNH